MWPFIVSRENSPTGNKILDRNFTEVRSWVLFLIGNPKLKISLVRRQIVRKLMLLRKDKSSLEKKITKGFFSSEWKSSKKKETLQDYSSVTELLVPWLSCLFRKRFRNACISGFHSLTKKSSFMLILCLFIHLLLYLP